jgi:predicted acylesterase/phospholipase RssA
MQKDTCLHILLPHEACKLPFVKHLKPFREQCSPLLAQLGLLLGLLATFPLPAQEQLRLEKREPDYRFRLRAEYRAPGQRKVAFALRGGSAKGLAHIGVFQGLDEENLAVDAITGTSAGSLMGSLYASGFSGKDIAFLFKVRDFGEALDDRRREAGWSLSEDELAHATPLSFAFRDGHLDLLPGDTRSRRMRMALMPLLGRAAWLAAGDFNQLRMPLRVVTTDITAGKGCVFASGSLVDVVMASTCLPGIFAPVWINGHQMVDGGPFENLPVKSSMAAFPQMAQVGVAIGRPWSHETKGNVLTLMDAALDMATAQTEIQSQALADLIIRPNMATSDEYDFHSQVDALVTVGRTAFDAKRPELEALLYGPSSEDVVASGVDLEAENLSEAEAWLERLKVVGPWHRRDFWRLLRRAYGDLPIADAVVELPAAPEGHASLKLLRAPIIQKIELDLPRQWKPTSKIRILKGLETKYNLSPGKPFHQGAWSQALEEMLVEAVMSQVPILDLQGSGMQPDGTLRLIAREPVLSAIRSKDPAIASRLERFLEPLRGKPIRTPQLEETLDRASTRLGLTRTTPDLRREDHGGLALALDPQKAPSLDLRPTLAYESTWGGHLGLDISSPDFLNTGTQLHLHGAVNDIQTRFQGHLAGVFRSLPSVSLGLAGNVLRQWFPDPETAPVNKLSRDNFGLRLQGHFGMEDRGLLQIDAGKARGYSRSDIEESPMHRASWAKAAFEWDSFDFHTLPTDGFMGRISLSRAFHADSGPTYSEGYLRLRRIWPHALTAISRVGLDVDLEFALQEHAPEERWFIAGGSESFIGSSSAQSLRPNMGILRIGFPFTAATVFGVAIQAVPRVDFARSAANYRDLYQGERILGYGLVLRGTLKSFYLELAGGETRARNPITDLTRHDRTLGFLIGTRPFDFWKGR